MDQYKLIEAELLNETQKKSSNSRGKLLVSTLVALAAAYVTVQAFSGPSDNQFHQRQTLWSNDKLTLLGWKTLSKLGINKPIQKIGVSSRGRIYAVLNETSYSIVRWFDTTKTYWLPGYSDMENTVDVQLDQSGIIYHLSSQNQLASSASSQTLPGIKKFAVSDSGKLHCIYDTKPSSKGKLNQWYDSPVGKYIYYKNDVVSDLIVNQETPIFVDTNSRLIGYGNICVYQVTAGADGSLWALSCSDFDQTGNDRQLLKWDDSVSKWYKIRDAFGVQVAAFNEISVVLLQSNGKIIISTEGQAQKELVRIDGPAQNISENTTSHNTTNSTSNNNTSSNSTSNSNTSSNSTSNNNTSSNSTSNNNTFSNSTSNNNTFSNTTSNNNTSSNTSQDQPANNSGSTDGENSGTSDNNATSNTNDPLSLSLFNDSVILNSSSINFVRGNLSQNYSNSYLCHRATRDGFNNSIFYQSCANRGPSLIIVQSSKGFVFGGYNPISWSSEYYRKGQEAAYIFSVDNNAVLRPQQNRTSFIVKMSIRQSPMFGLFDLDVYFDNPTSQMSSLGSYFQLPPGINKDTDQAKSFLAGEEYYQLAEVETYLLY